MRKTPLKLRHKLRPFFLNEPFLIMASYVRFMFLVARSRGFLPFTHLPSRRVVCDSGQQSKEVPFFLNLDVRLCTRISTGAFLPPHFFFNFNPPSLCYRRFLFRTNRLFCENLLIAQKNALHILIASKGCKNHVEGWEEREVSTCRHIRV